MGERRIGEIHFWWGICFTRIFCLCLLLFGMGLKVGLVGRVLMNLGFTSFTIFASQPALSYGSLFSISNSKKTSFLPNQNITEWDFEANPSTNDDFSHGASTEPYPQQWYSSLHFSLSKSTEAVSGWKETSLTSV